MEREEFIPPSYPTNILPKDWTKRKCYWQKPNAEFLTKIHHMEVRDDDVWIVTLPKCGTTWMQELVWLIMHDFDFEGAKNEHLEIRTPFLEFNFLLNRDASTALKPVEELKSPRLIKSHLPLPLLPKQLWEKKVKVIYVYRNPTDALVSMHYHDRSLGYDLEQTVEEKLRAYVEKGSLTQLPFDHVEEFYALRNEPWLYYTSFERMKRDLAGVISDICKFLDKNINEEQMEKMLRHLSFEEMKNNPKTNHHWEFEQVRNKTKLKFEAHNFVRKGQVDGYKEELTPEFIKFMDKWILENLNKKNLTLDELLLRDKN